MCFSTNIYSLTGQMKRLIFFLVYFSPKRNEKAILETVVYYAQIVFLIKTYF
jgi:hypothetical protein